MYYNKDIFDAHNMEYPSNDWTWADFEKMAMELDDPANDVYGAYLHTWQACFVNWLCRMAPTPFWITVS